MAAQEQAIRTKYIRKVIDKDYIDPNCRMCGERDETVAHILAECKMLAQCQYKNWRHDKVVQALNLKFVRSMSYQQVRNGMITALKLLWKRGSHSHVGYENPDRQRD